MAISMTSETDSYMAVQGEDTEIRVSSPCWVAI